MADKKQTVPVIIAKDNGRQIIGQAGLDHIGDGRIEINMIITAKGTLENLLPFVTGIVASFEARLGD